MGISGRFLNSQIHFAISITLSKEVFALQFQFIPWKFTLSHGIAITIISLSTSLVRMHKLGVVRKWTWGYRGRAYSSLIDYLYNRSSNRQKTYLWKADRISTWRSGWDWKTARWTVPWRTAGSHTGRGRESMGSGRPLQNIQHFVINIKRIYMSCIRANHKRTSATYYEFRYFHQYEIFACSSNFDKNTGQ